MGQGKLRVSRPRRRLLLGVTAGITALPACTQAPDADPPLTRLARAIGWSPPPAIIGEFVGPSLQVGHRLREPAASTSSPARSVAVAIVGGGVAGLSAARALRRAGIDDYRLFELDSSVGGNSRAGNLAGFACPWGAHYLPAPDLSGQSKNSELIELLREHDLIKGQGSSARYADEALCQAPQERLLLNGRWQSGLLPIDGMSEATLAQYRRFSELIEGFRSSGQFQIPSQPLTIGPNGDRISAAADSSQQQALLLLERISFDAWLNQQSLHDRHLRWYLDYCCRDDYGVASAGISAWAGIHYFASRHGFELQPANSNNEPVAHLLTWPQGNAWLTDRLAQVHRDKTSRHSLVLRIEHSDQAKSLLQVWLADENRHENWSADFVIVATPLYIAARLLSPVPSALSALIPKLSYSAWQVANVHLATLPAEKSGAPPSWDNVVFGGDSLGYVDATHQLLRSYKTEAVWSCYRALGANVQARRQLQDRSWRDAAQSVLDDLRPAYPDIERHVRRIDIVRWGHGMVVPTPGLRTDGALATLRNLGQRLVFAHSDLAAYSVFEEAFAMGSSAGRRIAQALSGSRTPR